MKTPFHSHMHLKQNRICTEEYSDFEWLFQLLAWPLWKIIAGFLLQESQISPHQQRFLHSTFGCCSLCWLYEDQQADLDICFVVSFIVRSKMGHFMQLLDSWLSKYWGR